MKYKALTPVGSYQPGDEIDGTEFGDQERIDFLIERGHLAPTTEETADSKADGKAPSARALKAANDRADKAEADLKAASDLLAEADRFAAAVRLHVSELPEDQQAAFKEAVNPPTAEEPAK